MRGDIEQQELSFEQIVSGKSEATGEVPGDMRMQHKVETELATAGGCRGQQQQQEM